MNTIFRGLTCMLVCLSFGCLTVGDDQCADRGPVSDYVAPEQRACVVDDDCTYVSRGCCSCSSGGTFVVVAKEFADQFPKRGCCANQVCPASYNCPEAVGCVDGECLALGRAEVCSAAHLRDAEVRVSTCDGSPDSFYRCECEYEGATFDVGDRSATCEAALAAECGATVDDIASCHEPERGTCVPGPGGSWLCSCLDGGEQVEVTAGSCEDAIWKHCEPSCTQGATSCAPAEHAGTYDCFCDYYGAERTLPASSCEEALARCSPPSLYANEDGFCDERTDGDFRCECQCLDGTSGSRTYEELGGSDDCGIALREICGA